jgi:predicted phage terminase large subunit-like protein
VESGRTAFEREKQGRPLNPELCEWPEDYFSEHVWFDEWPRDLAVRVVAIDPSKGSGDRLGDFTALVALGASDDGALWVEAALERIPVAEIADRAVEMCRQFGPDAVGVEVNQFQELLQYSLGEALARNGMPHCRPHAIDNRVNKQVRIRRLGPLLSARKLRFRSGSPGTRILVRQMQEFPLADHDDGPDALEMAVRLAAALWGGRPVGESILGRLG